MREDEHSMLSRIPGWKETIVAWPTHQPWLHSPFFSRSAIQVFLRLREYLWKTAKP